MAKQPYRGPVRRKSSDPVGKALTWLFGPQQNKKLGPASGKAAALKKNQPSKPKAPKPPTLRQVIRQVAVGKGASGSASWGTAPKPKTAAKPKTVAKPKAGAAPKYTGGSGGGGTSGGGSGAGRTSGGKTTKPATSPAAPKPKELSLEERAKKAVTEMLAPAFKQLATRKNDIDHNDAAMTATANAFKAWRDSRTDSAINSMQQVTNDAAANNQKALEILSTGLADTQARMLGQYDSSTIGAGSDVNAVMQAAMSQMANNASAHGANAASADLFAGNAQKGVDVANQQALVGDFAGITSAARKDLGEQRTALELQKAQEIQKYIQGERQAQMDQALQEYAMGKDAANLQFKYDELNSQRDIANSNNQRAVDVAKINADARKHAAQLQANSAATTARLKANDQKLKAQGVNSALVAKGNAAALTARKNAEAGWEKSKPEGQVFIDSVNKAVAMTYSQIMVAAKGVSRTDAYSILVATWGKEAVDRAVKAGAVVR